MPYIAPSRSYVARMRPSSVLLSAGTVVRDLSPAGGNRRLLIDGVLWVESGSIAVDAAGWLATDVIGNIGVRDSDGRLLGYLGSNLDPRRTGQVSRVLVPRGTQVSWEAVLHGFGGCAYPNVSYGPPVVDMAGSMADPNGPWVTTRRGLTGFGEEAPQSTTAILLGLLLGIGLVVGIAAVGFGGGK